MIEACSNPVDLVLDPFSGSGTTGVIALALGRRFLGIELNRDAGPVVPAALAQGVVVNRTAETVVRLLPPLVITIDEVDEGLTRLEAALALVEADGAAA
jgi:adenosylmethionine-8-amino-7-oxononanoate aminotransferase